MNQWRNDQQQPSPAPVSPKKGLRSKVVSNCSGTRIKGHRCCCIYSFVIIF